MLDAIRGQGLEGVVAKKKDSWYETGKRTGSWVKYRLNRGQELVIGGYIPGTHGVDAIVVGYYRGEDLMLSTRKTSGESDLGRPVSVVAESRLRVSPRHSPFYCRFQ
jgi:ATP-dependent DNA ligase